MRWLALAAALLAASPAAAGTMSARELFDSCRGINPESGQPGNDFRMICMAYLMGLADQHEMLRSVGVVPAMNCVPTMPMGAVSFVVVNWLQAHPEALGKSGAQVVAEALADKYPCQSAPSSPPLLRQ